MRTAPIRKRRRGAETVRALVRALLLAGPLGGALAMALASAPGARGDRVLAMDGTDALDATVTGSITRPSVPYAMGNPVDRANGGPCLRFPDGSQRGTCR